MLTYYAAPTPQGLEDGSSAANAGSLANAKTYAITNAGTDDVTIYLADGRYDLSAGGLSFSSDDSNSGGYITRWLPTAGAEPTFSGGVLVTDTWELHDEALNIYKAELPAGIVDARQIYVNDVRATRAKLKNFDPSKWLISFDGGHSYITCIDSTLPITTGTHSNNIEITTGNYSNPLGASTVYVENRLAATSFTSRVINTTKWATRDIAYSYFEDYTPSGSWGPVSSVENAYEFLSEEGEFFIDLAVNPKMIYYKPRTADGNMSTAVVYVPKAEKLLYSSFNDPPSNIEFFGIIFEHTSWLKVNNQQIYVDFGNGDYADISLNFLWNTYCISNGLVNNDIEYINYLIDNPSFYPPGMVDFPSSNGIKVEQCLFRHGGASGYSGASGTKNLTVSGSIFTDLSGSGVLFTGEYWRYLDNPVPYNKENITIANNYILEIGKEYKTSDAVHGRGGFNVKINYNKIDGAPYCGINVESPGSRGLAGGGGANHEYAYNDITRVMQKVYDGGGIYFNGVVKNRLVHDNYIHGIGKPNSIVRTWALYSDEGQTNASIYNNVVENYGYDSKLYWAMAKGGNHWAYDDDLLTTAEEPEGVYFDAPYPELSGVSPLLLYNNYTDLNPTYYEYQSNDAANPVTVENALSISSPAVAGIKAAAGLQVGPILSTVVAGDVIVYGWGTNVTVTVSGDATVDGYEENSYGMWRAVVSGYIEGTTDISVTGGTANPIYTPSGLFGGSLRKIDGSNGGVIKQLINNQWI